MSKFAWSCSASISVAALSAACCLVACGGDDDQAYERGDASLEAGAGPTLDATTGDAAADAGGDADASQDATVPADGGTDAGDDASDAGLDGASEAGDDAGDAADAADASDAADAADAAPDAGPAPALDVTASLNLSTTSTGTRTCADGGDMVAYAVTALATANGATTATTAAAPGAGCLSPGDTVLLLDVQGSPLATANVGTYELLTVSSVTASAVAFTTAKTGFYGATTGLDDQLGTQRVVLQRVPVYSTLTVESGGALTVNAWNSVTGTGGIFAASTTGAVSIAGTVTVSGLGFVGAPESKQPNQEGTQGESYDGPGAALVASNLGAGGGGRGNACASFGVGGGGGGYSAAGAEAAYGSVCAGLGGATYGSAALTSIFLGSGGGSGGEDDSNHDNPPGGFGGNGGGIVWLKATGSVTVAAGGILSADGTAGEGDVPGGVFNCSSTTSCWDYAGPGGGGSGGSVLINAASFSAAGTVSASGGAGGLSETGGGPAGNGGAGAAGYIVHP